MTTSNGGVSLVDLKGVSEPATKLVDVIARAIGVAYEPTHIRRLARANADAKIIATQANIEAAGLEERASNRVVHVETRRQQNIEAISTKAFSELPPIASKEPPSADWINNFFDLCKDISDEDLQEIWARLLAGEVSNPGLYSVRTLQALKTIDSREAKLFTSYCSSIWTFVNQRERVLARIIGAGNNALLSTAIRHMDVIHLAEIGLISYKNLRTIVSNGQPTEYEHLEIGDLRFSISPSSVWYNPLSWMAYLLLPQSFEMEFLTELGSELFRAISPKHDVLLIQATSRDLTSIGISLRKIA